MFQTDGEGQRIRETLQIARIALDTDPENSPPQWTAQDAVARIDALLSGWCDICRTTGGCIVCHPEL